MRSGEKVMDRSGFEPASLFRVLSALPLDHRPGDGAFPTLRLVWAILSPPFTFPPRTSPSLDSLTCCRLSHTQSQGAGESWSDTAEVS